MGSFTTKKKTSSEITTFSDVQKQKVHHLFNILDIDRNGTLQPDDFINVGRKIIHCLELDINSRGSRLILLKAHRLFIQLLIDLNNPEMELTLWDWVEFFRNQIESPNIRILDYYIFRTSRYIFDLFDLDNDRRISRDEYAHMLTVYNIPQNTVKAGFDELDTNNDDYISSDEMINGLQNFFKSSNQSAKGNLIFGDWR